MRRDGSETVRLLDDSAKDRNPTWSPDGESIAFMSTRSGEWELWSIRKDGSDLRPMTDLRADVYEAVWSADGRRVITSTVTQAPLGAWSFDSSTLATRQTATFHKNPTAETFSPEAWSPDGKLVAGSLLDRTGLPRMPAVWDLANGSVRALNVPPPEGRFSWTVAGWMPDSRRFLAASGTTLAIVDAATGRWSTIQVPKVGTRYRLNASGQTLMIERETLDADVWLMEIAR